MLVGSVHVRLRGGAGTVWFVFTGVSSCWSLCTVHPQYPAGESLVPPSYSLRSAKQACPVVVNTDQFRNFVTVKYSSWILVYDLLYSVIVFIFKVMTCLASADRLFHVTVPLQRKLFLRASVFGRVINRLCWAPRRLCLWMVFTLANLSDIYSGTWLLTVLNIKDFSCFARL